MPNVRTLLRSFAGGEISPEMYGRIDDEKYQTGAAIMRNFISKAQGPAENRPGFSYVAAVKNAGVKTRLIPFNFSSTDSCVIEFGAGYFRFHTNGAPILAATPSAYSGVTTYAPGDMVLQSSIKYYCIKATTGNAPPNTTYWYPLPTTAYEIPNSYTATELFDVHYVQSNDVITLVHPNHKPATLSRTSTSPLTWVLADMSVTPQIAAPTNVVAIDNPPASDPGPTKYTYSYVVTAIAEDGTSESAPSLPTTVSSNLNETGRTVTVSWPSVTGASRYYVYKLQSGMYGYIGEIIQSAGTLSINDENIAPDMSVTPPMYDDVFNLASSISSVTVNAGGSNYGSTAGTILNQVVTVLVKENSSGAASNPTFSVYGGSPTSLAAFNTHIDVATSTTTNIRTYTCTLTFTSGGLGYTTPYISMVHRSVTYNGPISTSTITLPALLANPLIPVLEVIDTAGSGTGASLIPTVSGGAITGVTVTSGGSGYISPVINVKNALGGSGATFTLNLSTPATGDYPGAVSYFEQRKCFAGSTNHPAQIWMTKSGTESNMSYSLPSKDDDRINFQVASREANTIRHIVPLTQLLLLTNSAEWRVSSTSSDVLTPTTISVRPQSYIGSSNVQPEIVNNTLIFCAARGGHVRECGYNWQSQGFITGDLSLRATHLFDNLEIMDMCYSKSPQPLLWFVSSNGNLLGFTYIPEQSVGSWHHHDTDGAFETCTTVSEGSEDVLYVVVKRTINGSIVRYVERMESRNFATLETSFFVDSGLTYNGNNTSSKTMTVSAITTYLKNVPVTITASAATFASTDVGSVIVLTDSSGVKYRLTITAYTSTTVVTAKSDKDIPTALQATATTVWAWARSTFSGLSHLNGKTVSILADGAVHSQRTVSAGTITLDRPYVIVTAGLPYQSDLKTLPLALQVDGGYGQGRMKNVNKVWMRVYRSSGIFIGPDADNLTEAKQRSTEPYGSPPSLKSDEVLVVITPTWADSGSVYVRQSDPLPLTITNMTMEVAIGA